MSAERRRATGARPRGFRSCVVLVAALGIALLPHPAPSGPFPGDDNPNRTTPGSFSRSGLAGSERAVMQPVTTGFRMALVSAVPGSPSGEAWAVASSTARVKGWAGSEGQTVFLRYTHRSGWRLVGPPVDGRGVAQNPNLTALAIPGPGYGWAVGASGAMARLVGDRWVMASGATRKTLYSVSLRRRGGDTFGFAVGDGPTVLRLGRSGWVQDSIVVPQGERWDLRSVAVVGPEEAWAAGSQADTLLVVHRTSTGWARRTTGRELFDEGGLRSVGGKVFSATRGFSTAAGEKTAWIGGVLVGVNSSATPDPAGDSSRPFVLRFDGDDKPTSFCPDLYTVGDDTARASTTAICDRPLPLASFGIVAMQAFGDKEVFAGGLGLFHYRSGTWYREPSPIGSVVSIGMASPDEGWIGGSGAAYGAATSASSISTLGHWTRKPLQSRIARWPEPITHDKTLASEPLEAVALAPDGSGAAMMVGQSGAMLRYTPGVGWDSITPVTPNHLHDVAWPAGKRAFAVGGDGTILRWNGTDWAEDSASHSIHSAFFSVAFSSPRRGYAVGAAGAIMRFDGGRWTSDPASERIVREDLYAVDAAGDTFVAVGASGTVLVNERGSWRIDTSVRRLIERDSLLPALYTVDGLPDGTVFVGGELGTLVRRDRLGGAWRIDIEGKRVPPEGTVVALAARRDVGGYGLAASVAQESLKYAGEVPGAITTTLLYGNRDGWRDIDLETRYSTFPAFDASATRDPILDLVFEGSDSPRAWAAAGTGPGNDDGQGHLQAYGTSSIYRVNLEGDPRPPAERATPLLDTDPFVVNFAFFGESACGRAPCSLTMGTGTRADAVALRIRDEVNRMAAMPGGPQFVVFGGSMRRTGIPEELGGFKHYVQGFDIPVFAALGRSDLFAGLDTAFLDEAESTGGIRKNEAAGPTDDSFFRNTFADMPLPWGTRGRRLARFEPVRVPGEEEPDAGSRTHYAFDFRAGSRRLRVIVLDNSIQGRLTDPSTQNPQQNQMGWLTSVLATAGDAASVIVMNRPSRNPLQVAKDQYPEAAPVERAAAEAGAAAVFTSFFRLNAVTQLKVEGVASTTPVYTFGGGGAPLESRPGKPPQPSNGYYHSWQLVSVNFDPARRPLPLRRPEVYVRSYPIVDALALHARDGVVVPAGRTLRFTGAGRLPDGGSSGDPLQSRATVVPMSAGTSGACPPDPANRLRHTCLGSGLIGPSYYFLTDDPEVGYFVAPDPQDPTLPYLSTQTGLPVPDPTSGLFCGINPGKTNVHLISGLHGTQMEVTVTGGSGSCIKGQRVAPPPPVRPPPEPEPQAVPPREPVRILPTRIDPLQAAVVPPPIPAPLPAAPPAIGAGRREEHEFQSETESSQFTALNHDPRRADQWSPLDVFPMACVAIFAVLSLAGATVAAERRKRACQPARLRNRWREP